MGKVGGDSTWKERAVELLGSRRVFISLLILNVVVTLFVMWASRTIILSDTWSYLGLAEGILNGRYSMWWQLGEGYPDTFRTPGYPLFIAAILWLFGNWHAVLVVQFILYGLGLWLALRTIDLLGGDRATRSLFLLLLLPLVNVPFYIVQLYAEIPVLAAIGLAVYLAVRHRNWNWKVAIAIGLLLGFVFQCRPVFLLFPLAYVTLSWVIDRGASNVRHQLLMLVVFALTVVPFGIWNKVNHGVFKVTPLQGAGSYMHLGYWSGKMPGYTDRFYLRNFNAEEVIHFTPPDSIPANIREYEQEWSNIKARIDPLLTSKDTAMWDGRPRVHHAEPTYNTAYTIMRDKLLLEKAVEHYWSDPWYTLAFKSYSAVRLWVIGIQLGEYQSAGFMGKMKMLYATISTGVLFLLFIVLVPLAYLRRVLSFRSTWLILLYLAYSTFIHLPFTIQSRYTVPVRLLMLILIALAITGLLSGQGKRHEVNQI
ncbi:MAG: glycosyltransferase family 39 protein [Flavobacteriales bacterium]|jgi:hypothetical protein|nr:glycosyltransferase family 39 protein [Flavobacteriales bacterium]